MRVASRQLEDAIAAFDRARAAHAVAAGVPFGVPTRLESVLAARIGYGEGEQVASGRYQQAADVDARADHGALWFAKLSGLKHRAVVAAKQIVDEAMLVAGGSSYFTRSELSRLYRDVLAGMFHPSDPESAHSTAASAWLGPLDI